MNQSGKALTVFLVVITIILICLTGIAAFLLNEERQMRLAAEDHLQQMKLSEAKLQAELKEAQKQLFVMEEKNKEAEDRLESLMEDLELEQGLREEIKKENRQLRETLTGEREAAQQFRTEVEGEVNDARDRIASLQQELDEAVSRNNQILAQRQDLEEQNRSLKSRLEQLGVVVGPMDGTGSMDSPESMPMMAEKKTPKDIDLERIVVNPALNMMSGEEMPGQGKLVSVDRETDFCIVDLGEQDGLTTGSVLSVYRGDLYLGDIRVSRVLPDMAAADFIPPLTSKGVQKEDQVVIKQ